MNKKGFTLIELLIVVVIIGILAAIAIPKFGESRERAYQAAMQSDLNQLRTAMEACLSDNTANPFTYTGCDTNVDFNESPGVDIEVTIVDAGSYTAAATHTSTERTCSYDSSTGQTTCDAGGGAADGGAAT